MTYTGKIAALVAAAALTFSGLGFSLAYSPADDTPSVTKVAFLDGDEKDKSEDDAAGHTEKMKEKHGEMSGDMKEKHDAMSDEMKEKMKDHHKEMHEEMDKDSDDSDDSGE